MSLTNKIQKELMRHVRGNSEIILPNFYYGRTECDVFKITTSDLVIEYEIKISRSDFFADFKKQKGGKHSDLRTGRGLCPNRFYYVMPEGLIELHECPPYVGLLFFNKYESFDVKKNAPLIHKRKFDQYRNICRTMAFREAELRAKISRIRNGKVEEELSYWKRLAEQHRKNSNEYAQELLMLKFENRKLGQQAQNVTQ